MPFRHRESGGGISKNSMKQHNYFVYIITNKHKNVIYTGVTNNIMRRLFEHNNPGLDTKSFAAKYNCRFLVYYEHFTNINHAIARETEIKKWRREKKNKLISSFNPEWKFLNEEIMTNN